MNLYLTILLTVLLLGFFALTQAIGLKDKKLGFIMAILIAGIILRYTALLIYLTSVTPLYLYEIRNFIMLSVISIPILSYICINKINKGSLGKVDVTLIPVMAIIYIYLIFMCPEKIVTDETGYKLILKNTYLYYLSVVQGVFSVYMIYITIRQMFKRTSNYVKTINIIFFGGYVLAVLEGLCMLFNRAIMKSPVLSEGILMLAIVVALRKLKDE